MNPEEKAAKLPEQSFHAYYEVWMLRTIAGLFAGDGERPTEEWDQFTRNALIESFAIHLRVLEDFFWGPPERPKPDDCFAIEFFPPGQWNPGAELDLPRDQVNKQIAHLTYAREIDELKKLWDLPEIYNRLLPTIKIFAQFHWPRDPNWDGLVLDLPYHPSKPAGSATGVPVPGSLKALGPASTAATNPRTYTYRPPPG